MMRNERKALPSKLMMTWLGRRFQPAVPKRGWRTWPKAVGLFLGIWPTNKEARLDPVDALRFEYLVSLMGAFHGEN